MSPVYGKLLRAAISKWCIYRYLGDGDRFYKGRKGHSSSYDSGEVEAKLADSALNRER